MLINTKFLGEIEIEEKDIISFQHGLPGFLELQKFALLAVEENPSLVYMQSLEETNICFIVTSPFLVLEDYQIDISEEAVQNLQIEKSEDVNLFVILTIPENMKDMTANLMAPIVINSTNNKAIQEIVSDDKYSIKHKLFRGE
jgi:flagellar assembly factor FliW